jgi:hypothetical protein
MTVIHQAAKINQRTPLVFVPSTKSAVTSAMILIQVFNNPEGNNFILVVSSCGGDEYVC